MTNQTVAQAHIELWISHSSWGNHSPANSCRKSVLLLCIWAAIGVEMTSNQHNNLGPHWYKRTDWSLEWSLALELSQITKIKNNMDNFFIFYFNFLKTGTRHQQAPQTNPEIGLQDRYLNQMNQPCIKSVVCLLQADLYPSHCQSQL